MPFDVIVVGAGPTGLLLACELALAGVRTRIVERREHPQPHSRALTLHPRSVELFDLRGIAPRFLGPGRPVPGWHFAGLNTRLDFTALDTRHPYTLFLAQARTEALLEERARELGVDLRRGHTVTAVRQDAAGAEVDVRGPDGAAETLRAAYVVGCDGARSPVREAAGIGFPGTGETLTGILGDFEALDTHDPALRRARERGLIVAPVEDGVTRLVLVDPARMRIPSREPVTLEEFRASLTDYCGSDCGVGRPRWLSRFGNATRIAERYRSGRILLAGDAAHIHFPAGGQGLNTGLQDAMNLGWKLAAEIHGWAPPGLLDSYDAERRPAGRAVTENTEVQNLLLELVLVEQYARPAAALRTLLDELLTLPDVNHRLAGRVSALHTAYPAAGSGSGSDPASDPDADQGADPGAPAGRRMPDIGLTTDAAGAGRAYELLHDGRFVVLHLAAPEGLPTRAWAGHVRTVTASSYEARPELAGVSDLLIRPDGHIAWAGRSTDPRQRTADLVRALTAWAGPRQDTQPC
ncbi:monooxygenase [Streptomyces sp. NPDC047718]|uniref:monooxygenase n=1 Tax=Streptomyces sp. NPDC047718 TaxID=3155479 RepID=UPI0033DF5480